MKVTQFGSGGVTYDTVDYPYVLLNPIKKEVHGRFSTLDKAHKGRLMHSLNHQDDMPLLYNENTKKFIDWTKEDRILFEKYKNNPSKYFEVSKTVRRTIKWRSQKNG